MKEKDNLMIFTFSTLALALVSTIVYMVYTIASSGGFIDHVITILGVIVLVILSILMVVTGFFIENKTAKITISIASIFLALYSIFGLIGGINSNKNLVLVPDFYNYDIKDVASWAKENNITIEQEFRYDDKIKEYHVISQSVSVGTNIKKVKSIKLIVSNGIDPTNVAPITNMVGWKLDDVLDFIDKNNLTNVTIKFEFSNSVKKDIIISQDVLRDLSVNDPLTLVSSLGKEKDQTSVTLDNLVGMDTFHALVYLGRNNIKYSIVYSYDKDNVGKVIKQSIKKLTVIDHDTELVITIAKENEITVPDLSKMNKDEITNWAATNHIKVTFSEEYDDTIKLDNVISYTAVKGSTISVGTNIKVVISKGPIKMIEFKDYGSFEEWANENEVVFDVEYEFSNDVKKGKLISSSHKAGQIIKNNETVRLVISEGGNSTVPNLIGLTKEQASAKCSESKVKCNFVYLNNDVSYTIVTKQSMKANSIVPNDTSITVTIGE